MNIKILEESGYEHALHGISLSYNKDIESMEKVAKSLCKLDGGHNKFLESMTVWLEIRAPRYWWSEADTYRVGVTKQSESTIHTILNRELTQDDFESLLPRIVLNQLNTTIFNSKGKNKAEFIRKIKNQLPEGFLQKRILCTNYKALKNIVVQRKNHILLEWKVFIKYLENHLEHANLIF